MYNLRNYYSVSIYICIINIYRYRNTKGNKKRLFYLVAKRLNDCLFEHANDLPPNCSIRGLIKGESFACSNKLTWDNIELI